MIVAGLVIRVATIRVGSATVRDGCSRGERKQRRNNQDTHTTPFFTGAFGTGRGSQMRSRRSRKYAVNEIGRGAADVLMSGPPGAGNSLLAACLPGILPPLQPAEALEVSMVASVAGELEGGRMTRRRPFRSPHHSESMPALVGGGLRVRPGEISLAHLGFLFLDELPEFQRGVLNSLRQPLETGNSRRCCSDAAFGTRLSPGPARRSDRRRSCRC